MTLIIVARL